MRFDIMFCSLGNGLTVCNRAATEHGDYKNIAHISRAGNIAWFIPVNKIPGDALLQIEHHAHAMESNFKAEFNALPVLKQYEFLLDRAPAPVLLECLGMKEATINEKIAFLWRSLAAVL